MSDRAEDELQAYAAVDDALRSLALAPAPPGLTAAVMAQIQALPDSPSPQPVLIAERPRFRLTWLDAALSLFAAGMIALVWLLSATLPPILFAQLRNQGLYALQSARLDPWLPVVLLGGTLLGGTGIGLIISLLVVRRRA